MLPIEREIRLLTKSDVARWLKLRPETVARMARRGDLPGKLIGNRWRFRLVEIERWLATPT